MRHVTVDPTARRARFEGGCLLGTIDTATQSYGLAFPAGVVSHTGASGLILGGGFGCLTRLHRLSCDNVESFTLVTLTAAVVRADANENSDLSWALRGGGGNFGVVTEFEVRLHPVTSVVLGEAYYCEPDIPRFLRSWRDSLPEVPANLRWSVSLRLAPRTDNVPLEIRGRPVASVAAVWGRDSEKGLRYLDHILSIGSPVGVTSRVMSSLALQTIVDHEFPPDHIQKSRRDFHLDAGCGNRTHFKTAMIRPCRVTKSSIMSGLPEASGFGISGPERGVTVRFRPRAPSRPTEMLARRDLILSM
jgi:FAD binding domain-containing protein